MITITFEADGLIKKLQVMGNRVKNLRPFLKDVGDYLVKESRLQFENGGVPKWKESVFGGATLLKSGKLRDSVKILETTDNSVTVGTTAKGGSHNFGYEYFPKAGQRRYLFWMLKRSGLYDKSKAMGGNKKFVVPQRRFLKLDADDRQFIATKLEQYIVKD